MLFFFFAFRQERRRKKKGKKTLSLSQAAATRWRRKEKKAAAGVAPSRSSRLLPVAGHGQRSQVPFWTSGRPVEAVPRPGRRRVFYFFLCAKRESEKKRERKDLRSPLSLFDSEEEREFFPLSFSLFLLSFFSSSLVPLPRPLFFGSFSFFFFVSREAKVWEALQLFNLDGTKQKSHGE